MREKGLSMEERSKVKAARHYEAQVRELNQSLKSKQEEQAVKERKGEYIYSSIILLVY